MAFHPYTRLFGAKSTFPTSDDDETLGYEVGDFWIRTNGAIFQCFDATEGGALWLEYRFYTPDQIDSMFDTLPTLYAPLDILTGWKSVSQAWTYASADDPIYQVYVSGDVTANADYKLGNKIKCTNNSTTFYGFIVKVGAYDSGNTRTPIDIYGGTDYDLANSAITAIYIGKVKSPDGFPLDPDKWTVSLSDAANRAQGTPTASTWYNPGSLSLNIPIGKWFTSFSGAIQVRKTTGGSPENIGLHASLSTANNSESDVDFTASLTGPAPASLTNATLRLPFYRRKLLSLTAKTAYYIVMSTGTSSAVDIQLLGAVNTTLVKCVCAYL